MSQQSQQIVGIVTMLYRYPVKSMLGETRDSLTISARGAAGDRVWALLDRETNKVASAKRPKLWRGLLRCLARTKMATATQRSRCNCPTEQLLRPAIRRWTLRFHPFSPVRCACPLSRQKTLNWTARIRKPSLSTGSMRM